MNTIGLEFFEDLMEINSELNSTTDKYPKMRSLLERICKNLTSKERIQFSNLFSRLSYVCDKTKLDKTSTFQINTLRINANKVLHSSYKPTSEEYLQDLRALSNVLKHFYDVEIPPDLKSIFPKNEYQRPKQKQEETYDRIRIEVSTTDSDFIYGFDEKNPTDEPIKVRYNVNELNQEFNPTVLKLWKGCQLNLIDVTIDDNNIYLASLIILEPDYLIDISSLAECMKEYGKSPLNFIKSKFEPVKNSKHILLGNAANIFLDELVNEKAGSPVNYVEIMREVFKSSPFEFSTSGDIDFDFFQETQIQFQNIRNVIANVFPQINVDRENGILEPHFICEHLGVQGRLDFLQLKSAGGRKFVIELKSGKAPFPENDFSLIGINHQAQAFIYQMVIQKVLGVKFDEHFQTYIFYSKYADSAANLRLSKPFMTSIREILNIRNLIVANEKGISGDETESETKNIINGILPSTLITNNNVRQNFLDNYVIPQINNFKSVFNQASELELEYFHIFYSFVAKEHYISKTGDTEYESSRGISSLWLSSLDEKVESGEILTDLTVSNNHTETYTPTITLVIPKYEHEYLSNFRQGDIVILYERNRKEDNVTNKQVFKGSIQNLTQNEITIRIRYKQRNQSVLPKTSKYAIEHDFLDSGYNSMYRGLYSFLHANQDRRDLLLNQREPRQDEKVLMEKVHETIEIQDIVWKAKAAKDYFLLIGPPGTGKTSKALKSMVEEYYCEPTNNILLLAYTNRAVDEICDALNTIEGNLPFIRIGSELSCEYRHREKLLEKIIVNCNTRDQVKAKIQGYRVFVGTVSSISNKSELFKLKYFQVAIVDEASQILEPYLIGILSAKNVEGGDAVEKFILIGDYKQLPAVVLQKESDSVVNNLSLNQIGMFNRRRSLFERLYNLHKSKKESLVWGMLHKQGRMHPEIALFPNYSFYNSQLQPIPTSQQRSYLNYEKFDTDNSIQKLIASKRLAFIPSEKNVADKTNKTNLYEAKIASALVKNIHELFEKNNRKFSAMNTVGIITPYRSQIALIKKEIHGLNIPELNDITVDTVERFQGSQREIIIFSASINQYYQLDFISNSIEDNGQTIDRKLNVAITRAESQLFIIGNPSILSNDLTYYKFIEFIRSKSGYINASPEKFIQGNFNVEDPDTDIEIGSDIYEPDQFLSKIFEDLIIQPIKTHPKTIYPNLIYGYDHDYIRLNVIQYGRTKFDQGTLDHSSMDKVNLYCFYNMRKHYFSSFAIFKGFADYFEASFLNSNYRITFIDFGCGPLTSGLAFNQSFSSANIFYFNYIGIDISNAMLLKAKEFSESGLFSKDSKFQFVNNFNEISKDLLDSVFTLSNTVILNFSYLFGNLTNDESENIASRINFLIDSFPLNKYVLVFQNSSSEKRNRSYNIFKMLVPRLVSVTQPKSETVIYRNAIMSNYDKSETVYYEILSN